MALKADILNTKVGIWLVSLLGSWVLRVFAMSFRWKWVGFEGDVRYWSDGPARILTFWHSQALFMPWVYRVSTRNLRESCIYTLTSRHGDGRLIASTIKRLGADSVAGSSSKGGSKALKFLIRNVKKGAHAAITPDGPRGPREKSKGGVVELAAMTGAPIFPVALVAESEWRLGSWDRMRIPRPFSRIVAIAGEQIYVPRKLTKQEFRETLERVDMTLNALTTRAERYFADEWGPNP